MSLMVHALAVLCVALIAFGQVLLKYSANALKASGSFFDAHVLGFAAVALAIYGGATILWIVLLRDAPLSRLYPYMALSFVLVTAAGAWLFQEQLVPGHLAGLALIVVGLLLVALS